MVRIRLCVRCTKIKIHSSYSRKIKSRIIINFTKIKKLILQIPTTIFLIKPNIINIKY